MTPRVIAQPGVYRLTFKPAGAVRAVSVWAKLIRETDGCVFWVQRTAAGDETEPMCVIVTGVDNYTARPAGMDLHYAQFVVLP